MCKKQILSHIIRQYTGTDGIFQLVLWRCCHSLLLALADNSAANEQKAPD